MDRVRGGHCIHVVAKIGDSYQTLVQDRHAGPPGPNAVKQALQLVKIFSAPANKSSIRRELHQASQSEPNSNKWRIDVNVPLNPDRPKLPTFPFLQTCVRICRTVDVDRGRARSERIAYQDFRECENRAWYLDHHRHCDHSVFDITHPDDPHYAFFFGRELSERFSSLQRVNNSILSAQEYLHVFFPRRARRRRRFKDLAAELQRYSLISLPAYQRVWSCHRPTAASLLGGEDKPESASTARTLKEMCLNAVFKGALRGELPETTLVDIAGQLPFINKAMQRRLDADKNPLSHVSGPSLFLRFQVPSPIIDLTCFTDVTPDQIRRLLAALPQDRQIKLHLPDMINLNPMHLDDFVSTGKVIGLHLGHTWDDRKIQQFHIRPPLQEFTATDCHFWRQSSLSLGPDVAQPDGIPRMSGRGLPLVQFVYLETDIRETRESLSSQSTKYHLAEPFAKALPLKGSLIFTSELPRVVRSMFLNMTEENDPAWYNQDDQICRYRPYSTMNFAYCTAIDVSSISDGTAFRFYVLRETNNLIDVKNQYSVKHIPSDMASSYDMLATKPQKDEWVLFMWYGKGRGSLGDPRSSLDTESRIRYAFIGTGEQKDQFIALPAADFFSKILGAGAEQQALALTKEWDAMLASIIAEIQADSTRLRSYGFHEWEFRSEDDDESSDIDEEEVIHVESCCFEKALEGLMMANQLQEPGPKNSMEWWR